ncbi:MAG: pyruvate kinase alpha/beta domain-containing protein [Syntrophales bacterium]|jgi:hypothetical protein|nr:pyruvate kinase alpha/beta domain-containing protein [Syntrophales bacterium]
MTASASFLEIPCRYFSKPGPADTEAVLEAVCRRAEALSINRIIMATCSGRTVFEALKRFNPALKIVAVTHVAGFNEPNVQELSEKDRQSLQARGVQVLTCAHAFGGVGRGVRNKVGTYQVDEVMAFTLRIFGQGTKVAVEIALMAADAGLVRTDEDVISVGGTGKGADTALVLRPAISSRLFDLRVRELICKPANP